MNYAAQTRIDRYVENFRPDWISCEDPEILEACGFNREEAEEELRIWNQRHQDTSQIFEGEILRVRVYTSTFRNPEDIVLHNNFVKMKRRMNRI